MNVESLSGGKFTITAVLMTDCYAIFHALNREIFGMKYKLSMNDLAKVAKNRSQANGCLSYVGSCGALFARCF